jgi:DNA polymerase-3 subunit alpha
MISFIQKNLKYHPGSSVLRFILSEPKNNMRISLVTANGGFEMNEEMIHFLQEKPELEVQVLTS